MSLAPVYEFGAAELGRWLGRRPRFDRSLVAGVSRIIEEVELEGGMAVLRHSREFDAPDLGGIWVSDEEISGASVGDEDLAAIRTAAGRVRDFHETQLGVMTHDWAELDFGWGWRTDATDVAERGLGETGFEGQRLLPLASAGVYVPGGRAAYPSSVIMNVAPALVAGVGRVVVATPARRDGSVDPAVLTACRELGVTQVLKAGGASAVAALALGFGDSEAGAGLARVDKVVGPGNAWVNEAKRQLWGSVGLDGYAGPSEVAVVADDSADPVWAAADLVTQVEHAPDNVGMLVCFSREMVERVFAAAEELLAGESGGRREIVREALREHGVAVVVESREEALSVVNGFAPEHLSVHLEDAGVFAQGVVNCGCVLIGGTTPQSCGDFVSGPSHTLPTSGAARFGSPVSVADFLKLQSVGYLTAADVGQLAGVVEQFAGMEGFGLHGAGARVRVVESSFGGADD